MCDELVLSYLASQHFSESDANFFLSVVLKNTQGKRSKTSWQETCVIPFGSLVYCRDTTKTARLRMCCWGLAEANSGIRASNGMGY